MTEYIRLPFLQWRQINHRGSAVNIVITERHVIATTWVEELAYSEQQHIVSSVLDPLERGVNHTMENRLVNLLCVFAETLAVCFR